MKRDEKIAFKVERKNGADIMDTSQGAAEMLKKDLIQSGPIHVDCGTDGENKPDERKCFQNSPFYQFLTLKARPICDCGIQSVVGVSKTGSVYQ